MSTSPGRARTSPSSGKGNDTRLSPSVSAASHGPGGRSSPDRPVEVKVPVPLKRASISEARTHMQRMSCTVFRPVSRTYIRRPLWGTSREQIGQYGVGLQLHFEFLARVGTVLLVMGVLVLPLLVFNYLGDFGGFSASVFAKFTIGNIGICGAYGELCPDVESDPYRRLISTSTTLLRDVTPVFGGLSTVAIGLFSLYIFYFYYVYMERMKRSHEGHELSLADYAVEVDHLPRKLDSEEEHATYEGQLAAHFNKIAGKQGAVVEVAVARDYHGGIRTYLELHELEVDIGEGKAQLKRCVNEKEEAKYLKRLKKLESLQSKKERAVMLQGYTNEYDRPVCRAFIVFSEVHFQERVVEAYKWSTKGFLLRWCQPSVLKFNNFSLRVRRTNEPGNIYHENLDVSSWERRIRTLFTVIAAVGILVCAMIFLVLFKSATRTDQSVGVGSKPVWIVANSTPATSTCFETCGITFYSDLACSQSLNEGLVGVLESSGMYTPFDEFISTSCAVGKVWRSDRCVETLARNDASNSDSNSIQQDVYSGFLTNSITPSPSSASSSLPESSPVCSAGSTLCSFGTGSSPDLQICYSPADRCNNIWTCPNGDDEKLCPSISCDSKCPSSGLCIDVLTGNCGSECLVSPASSTCQAISARTSAQSLLLDMCASDIVSNILESTFNGQCSGGFFKSPCCVLSQVSNTQKTYLASCLASSVVDDTAYITSQGLSMLGFMEAYCFAETRAENSLNTKCLDSDVWQTYTFSTNCNSAMSWDIRWCECLQDLVLIPLGTKNRLEQCQISSTDYNFFGSRSGFNRLTSFMDMLRTACQATSSSTYFLSKQEDFTSPLVSMAFQISSTSTSFSSKGLWDLVSSSLSGLSLTANVSLSTAVQNSIGNVRIDIFDRSDSTSVAVWNQNVALTYNLIQNSIISVFGVTPRVFTQTEPHCPASSMFQCFVTRACISPSQVCDGIPDCRVAFPKGNATQDENELNCPNTYSTGEGDSKKICAIDEFQCLSANQCIPNLFWCDGIQDCSDKSDETDSDCLVQMSVRNSTNSSSTALNAWDRSEFLAYAFNSPVSVQCVSINQPLNSLSSVIKVYACDESVVFRPGQGAVLRYPDLNCVEVQSTAIRSANSAKSMTVPQNSLVNPSNMIYNVFRPLPIHCSTPSDPSSSFSSSSLSLSFCELQTGEAGAFCGSEGVCELPINGSIANMTVVSDPVCDYGSPISPTVGSTVLELYTDPTSGAVNTSILSDLTYTCFCEQQAEYNSASNSLFTYPPYSSSVQKTCETYYTQLIKDRIIGILAVIVVAGLNFLLRLVMYWLSDFERKYSLTGKVGSEMWKLFLAQFINTAILVLIVNAKFYGSNGWGLAGLGAGQYPDTTKEWFITIGSGLTITMLILIGSLILPTIFIQLVWRWCARRWARKKLTQKAMNRQVVPSDFMLSMRLAQSTNMIVVTVLYFSSMPLMVWIGAAYCFLSYWADKFFLLRYARIPPQYSDYTVKICLRLLPIAVIGNCLLMVWTMSNQEVFPSDVVSSDFNEYLYGYFSAEQVLQYISGSSQFENSLSSYRKYIISRLLDSFRKASIGGYVILAFIALYLFCLIVYFLILVVFGPIVQLFMFGISRKKTHQSQSSSKAKGTRKSALPYEEVKRILETKHCITSYKMKAHPKYVDAYDAINTVRHKAAIKSEKARQARIALAGNRFIRRKSSDRLRASSSMLETKEEPLQGRSRSPSPTYQQEQLPISSNEGIVSPPISENPSRTDNDSPAPTVPLVTAGVLQPPIFKRK